MAEHWSITIKVEADDLPEPVYSRRGVSHPPSVPLASIPESTVNLMGGPSRVLDLQSAFLVSELLGGIRATRGFIDRYRAGHTVPEGGTVEVPPGE